MDGVRDGQDLGFELHRADRSHEQLRVGTAYPVLPLR
jgi:hypothetical protein